ncbi:MAG: signal peptidase I [Clostridia bacterium]|nr:signal peptidase I [Clostridia bacterium]
MSLRDMSTDRKTLWLVAIISTVALLPALFLPVTYSRILTAVLLAAAAVAAHLLIKKRSILSHNYRQVLGLLVIVAAVYIMLNYMSGIYFGFYQNYPALSLSTFVRYILPAAVVIVTTEIIRFVLLAQKGTAISIVTYFLCVISELLLGRGMTIAVGMNQFLDIVGLTLLPAITSNLLYHYLSKRYGALPNIAYRLILSLTMSFLPYVPAIPDALNAFILLILPLIVWIFIDALYEKKFKKATHRTSKWTYVGTGAILAVMVCVIMLITCQFRFGLLVIASPSMEGEISVGDAVIYEAYDDQTISEGDVIVFSKNGTTKIVHRVVNTEKINGQVRYYTKGDANNDVDYGYITESNIEGVVRLKVSGIGYPSLWLRDLFK